KKTRLWLRTELESWTASGVIGRNAAAKLEERYKLCDLDEARSKRMKLVLIVVSLIGATMLGMGVILFFAANWDQLAPPHKVALILAAIVTAYSLGYECRFGRWKLPILGEALILLGALFYGAGIWLIAQIYNINAHYPNGALLWGLGILPVAIILRSLVVTALASLLFALYYGLECFTVASPNYLYLCLALGMLGAAYAFRSRLLAFVNYFGVAVWFIVSYSVLASWPLAVGPRLCLLVFAGIAAYFLARMHNTSDATRSLSPMYVAISFFTVTIPMYLMTFGDVVRGIKAEAITGKAAIVFWAGIAAFSLLWTAAVALLARRERADRGVRVPLLTFAETVIAIFVAAVALVFFAFRPSAAGDWLSDESVIALIFNLLLAVVLIGMVAVGSLRQMGELVRFGLFGVVVVLASRYFDMFWELMSRSQFFIIGGVLLLIVSWLMERARRKLTVEPKEVSHA
ncbi:MAG: DUF2157 domain-containing protein, partial [Planctomycetes bacterium]|nr:DUF2157 domain-containing protein [Planctomycetota bacterium]